MRVISDVGLLQDVVVTAVLPMVAKALILIGMVVLMFWLNWKLTLVALAVFPLFWLRTVSMGRKINEVARQQRKREGAMAATASETILAIKTIQAFSLESAFEERGTPFHLFVYQPHDRYEGKFIHRTPSGELRVIVRPEYLHELEGSAPVIVKMNGGPRLTASLPDTFSVATRDFYRLAARVPKAFPAFLISELSTRSLLIMAHGLKEPDMEEVIRFSCAQKDAGRSWALKYRPKDTGPDEAARKYWEAIGLDFLWGPIEACMDAIEQAVAR